MSKAVSGATPQVRITHYIADLPDWRGETLARVRKLILDAAPELVEQWKWNVPLWSCRGNVLAVGAFKDHVKLNFFHGAALEDPAGLFNAGLEAKGSRAIDIRQGEKLDERALRQLLRAAVALDAA